MARSPSLSRPLAAQLRTLAPEHAGGALAVLARVYAAEIDNAPTAAARARALKDYGPKLTQTLAALGLAPGRGSGVVGGGRAEPDPVEPEVDDAPAPLGDDELAARRQIDALDRLEQRARSRRPSA